MALKNQLIKDPTETNKRTKIFTNNRLTAQRVLFFFSQPMLFPT